MHDRKQVRRRRAVLGVLVATSLILLTAYFGAPRSSPLHQAQRAIVEVLSPVQEGASTVLSPIRDLANWFSSTLHAKSEVAALRKQNQFLAYENTELQLAKVQNKQYRGLLHLDMSLADLSDYTLVATDVYSYSSQLFNETIDVEKGTDDGVAVGDPVIGDGGLVGDVTIADPSVSVVTLITDPSFGAAAEVLDAAGDQGFIVPETGNPQQMQMEYLPSQAQISTGERVVTSGRGSPLGGSLYPYGIPIGTVTNADSNTLINDQTVQVSPAVDLRHLTTVQILTKPSAGTERAQAGGVRTAQVPRARVPGAGSG